MKHVLAGLMVCAAVGGCTDEVVQRPPSLAVQQIEARASASTMVQAFRSGEIAGACGSPAPSGALSALVLVNARQCLSCRDLGYMLRRLPGQLRQGVAPLLVTPAADTVAVCPFVRQERIRIPVVAVTRNTPELENAAILMLATLGRDTTVESVHFALRGSDLLERLGSPAQP
jgi:hypothetical protein